MDIGTEEPYTPGIQEIFTPSEKMALGLSINQQLDQNITFSKYTFFNRKSGEETEIGVQDDLGPFEPGQVILIAWINPWPVPDEPGNYELRVYMGNEMVASAVFEVK